MQLSSSQYLLQSKLFSPQNAHLTHNQRDNNHHFRAIPSPMKQHLIRSPAHSLEKSGPIIITNTMTTSNSTTTASTMGSSSKSTQSLYFSKIPGNQNQLPPHIPTEYIESNCYVSPLVNGYNNIRTTHHHATLPPTGVKKINLSMKQNLVTSCDPTSQQNQISQQISTQYGQNQENPQKKLNSINHFIGNGHLKQQHQQQQPSMFKQQLQQQNHNLSIPDNGKSFKASGLSILPQQVIDVPATESLPASPKQEQKISLGSDLIASKSDRVYFQTQNKPFPQQNQSNLNYSQSSIQLLRLEQPQTDHITLSSHLLSQQNTIPGLSTNGEVYPNSQQQKNFNVGGLGQATQIVSSSSVSTNTCSCSEKSASAVAEEIFALQVSLKLQQKKIEELEVKNRELSQEVSSSEGSNNQLKQKIIETESNRESLFSEVIQLRQSVSRFQQQEAMQQDEVENVKKHIVSLEIESKQLQAENVQMKTQLNTMIQNQQNTNKMAASYELEISQLNATIRLIAEKHQADMTELSFLQNQQNEQFQAVLQDEKANRLKILLKAENDYMRSQFDHLSAKISEQAILIANYSNNMTSEGSTPLQTPVMTPLANVVKEVDDEQSDDNDDTEKVEDNTDAQSFTSIMQRSRQSSASSSGLSRREKPKTPNAQVQLKPNLLFVVEEGFLEARIHSNGFVDKSTFIKQIIKDQNQVILLKYPRGFGKSTNLQMLEMFLQKPVDPNGVFNEGKQQLLTRLFVGGEIAFNSMALKLNPLQVATKYLHGGKSDIVDSFGSSFVIFLDLSKIQALVDSNQMEPSTKGVACISHDNYILGMKGVLAEVFSKFAYLKDLKKVNQAEYACLDRHLNQRQNSSEELVNSLRFLSGLLAKRHQQKVYIIVDSYDSGLGVDSENNARDHSNSLLLGNIIERVVSANSAKVIISGVYEHSQVLQCVGPNAKVQVYGMDDVKYRKYFGLHGVEIEQIVFNMVDEKNQKTVVPLIKDAIKEYYSGYTSRCSSELYNMYSVQHYFKEVARLCGSKKVKQAPKTPDYWNDKNAEHYINAISSLFGKLENPKFFLEQLDAIGHGQAVAFIPELKEFEVESNSAKNFRMVLESSGLIAQVNKERDSLNDDRVDDFASYEEIGRIPLQSDNQVKKFKIANKEVAVLFRKILSIIFSN